MHLSNPVQQLLETVAAMMADCCEYASTNKRASAEQHFMFSPILPAPIVRN
jgi:hypothetical protein